MKSINDRISKSMSKLGGINIKTYSNVEKDLYNFLAAGGLLASNMYFNLLSEPYMNVALMGLTALAGGSFFEDILTSKWDNIFKDCRLSNNKGEAPKELKKEKTDKGLKYTFKIPRGYTLSDFINKQTELETALNQQIAFNMEDNNLVMYYCKDNVLNWQRIFKNCKLYNNEGYMPELIQEEENVLGKKYTFKLPMGIGLNKILEKKEEFEIAIKQPLQVDITEDYKLIMQVYDIKYKDIYKPDAYGVKINPNDLRFYTGITLTAKGEKVTYFDLTRSNSHLLIPGMSGKGKTILTRYLVAQTMLKNNTSVYIADLKATGAYNKFKDCKNLKKLVKLPKETERIVDEAINLMQERYKILDDLDLNDQMEYNKKFPKNKMENIIFLIEEFVALSRNADVIEKLNLLLAQASGAGIFIWLTVQRPCAKTLDTRLKGNLSYTIALKAKNSSNSEVYLDKGDYRAKELLVKAGECLMIKEDEDILFKAFYLETDEIVNMVKHTYIIKEPEIEIKEVKEEPKKEVSLLD